MEKTAPSLSATLLPLKLTNDHAIFSNADAEGNSADAVALQDEVERLYIDNKELKLRNDLLDQSLINMRGEIVALRCAARAAEEELQISKNFGQVVMEKLEAGRRSRDMLSIELGSDFLDKSFVFAPYEPGVYVPLVLENSVYIMSNQAATVRFVLDVESLPAKYASVARHNSFIIVARVDSSSTAVTLNLSVGSFAVQQLRVVQLIAMYTFDESTFTCFTLVDN